MSLNSAERRKGTCLLQEQLMQIAIQKAKQQAKVYTEQERLRDRPLSVQYVTYTIGMKIGTALFDAGYGFDDLDTEQRQAIAQKALADAGYPGI